MMRAKRVNSHVLLGEFTNLEAHGAPVLGKKGGERHAAIAEEVLALELQGIAQHVVADLAGE
jgi:hypothetical protein